jgi:hypothetical protein
MFHIDLNGTDSVSLLMSDDSSSEVLEILLQIYDGIAKSVGSTSMALFSFQCRGQMVVAQKPWKYSYEHEPGMVKFIATSHWLQCR